MRRPLLALAWAALLLVFPRCGERPPPAPANGSQAAYDEYGAPARPIERTGPRPNVVLVVIDTLRADMLDVRAADGGAMPRLAARAKRGVAFTQASAPAPWTLPSMTSLLTGRLPRGHGVHGEEMQITNMHALATWAEILANGLGYRTEAWVGAPWRNAPGQILEGFQRATANVNLLGVGPLIQRLAADQRATPQPFFLLLHSFEVHDPYGEANHPHPPVPVALDPASDPVAALGPSPPADALTRGSILDRAFHAQLWRNPAYAELLKAVIKYEWSGLRDQPNPALAAELRTAYTAGATWVDGLLDNALAELGAAHLLDNTLLIVTGDHGEAFGEHGMLLHGRHLYDELLRVPLVIVGPEPFAGGRVVEGSASLLDLLPTVLDVLRAPLPADLDGTSLVPLARGNAPGHPAFSEEVRTAKRTAGESVAQLNGVRSEAWKVILTYDLVTNVAKEEAYDLRSDPGETKNLADPDGRLRGMPFDPAFCAAVERLRDRLWSSGAASLHWLPKDNPYGATGVAKVLEPRPPPACDPRPPR